MNKNKFIEKLKEEANYPENKCILINDVFENHFIIGKKNKQKIINELISKSFTEDDSENIYDISMNIITNEIKNKIRNIKQKKSPKL